MNSKVLSDDRIEWGQNAGLYQRAAAREIFDHSVEALECLSAAGRARCFPMRDYLGDWFSDHTFV